MLRPRRAAGVALFLLLSTRAHGAPPAGYEPKLTVSAPTHIDWTFALATQSLPEPPADWLGDYESTAPQYELYVPPRRDPKKPLPMVLFISPSNEPMGWRAFESLCKQRGFVFAGPRGAGNDCPAKKRVRIVLDVLDDVRRKVPIDPDRTYVTGHSGGGRMACAVAFALPEYFGGVMPICAGADLRPETWLRQRVVDRLSVALLTGQTDFNRGEVERLRGPYLKEVGVRTKVWTQPGLGHAIPNERFLSEALRWLEDALPARIDLARRHPATRALTSDKPLTREQQAEAIYAEGKLRMTKRETLYSGLMLLQGCMNRWPDLGPATEAKKLLLEYESKEDRPWEAEDIAEQRKFLIAQARSLDAYASGELPAQYAKMRPDMARQALELWRKVQADMPDSPAGKEASKRILALEKIATTSP